MHRSLKLIAALSLGALVMAAPVRAEDAPKKEGGKKERPEGKGGAKGNPADRLQHVVDELGLTAEQKTAVTPIVEQAKADIAKIMQDAAITQEEKRPKIREVNQAAMAKIESNLTQEQKDKLKAMQAERQKGAKGGADGAKKGKKEGGDK